VAVINAFFTLGDVICVCKYCDITPVMYLLYVFLILAFHVNVLKNDWFTIGGKDN